MSDKVRPALTEEEWDLQTHDYAQMGRPPLPQMVTEHWCELAIRDRETTPEERNHAMAAMCLHGQPFGFTWEDVDALRGIHDKYDDERLHRLCESVADRIAALLPPRETKPEP